MLIVYQDGSWRSFNDGFQEIEMPISEAVKKYLALILDQVEKDFEDVALQKSV